VRPLCSGAKSQADEQREWEERKATLERELEGLNNRIRNLRRKIVDQERELGRLEGLLRAPQASHAGNRTHSHGGAAEVLAVPSAEATEAESLPERPSVVGPLDEGLAELERLADVVAGQKLHLAEQCRRLQSMQERWDDDHRTAVEELERLEFACWSEQSWTLVNRA
jgi:DNA repair exonuclease SbcCD ATPase subunit